MPKKLTAAEKEVRKRCNQVRAMMRRAWSRDPERYRCIREGRRDYEGPNKRQRFEYQCNMCKEWFKQGDLQVDHIIPCGSFLNYDDIGGFAYRLFFGELQKLCKPCHLKKTKEDRENAKKAKD